MAKRQKKNMFNALLFVMLFALCLFSVSSNFIKIVGKQNERIKLQKQLKELKHEEVVLKKDIAKMQSEEYIAKYAREKYFYSKPNEIIIKLD